MAIEKLKEELIAEAGKEASRISRKAEGEAEKIISGAKAEEKRIMDEAKKSTEQMIKAEFNERRSAMRLKSRRLLQEATDRKVEEELNRVWQEFAGLRKRKGYEKLLSRLIKEGCSELGSGAVVSVSKEDMKTAAKLCKNLSKKPAAISGGAVISAQNGRISINNSFESLFAQRKEQARNALYAVLVKKGGKIL
jgi:vacuolar-type H+-ATPase subunit E/Vma4